MRIMSFNANGIRSASRKGFFEWFTAQDVDVLCIQETKAQEHQLDDEIFFPAGYHRYLFDAQKKGYSGVAIYAKVKPREVRKGLGWDPADSEGRWIEAEFRNVTVISLYLPSGSSGEEAQAKKFRFLDKVEARLHEMMDSGEKFIICADWNICHKEIDLKNWRGNKKNSGFLPEERAWLDKIYDDFGWVDVFRNLTDEEVYTWWSNRGQAYTNNTGWRLDYHVVTPNIAKKAYDWHIERDLRFSDHAAMWIDYKLVLR